MSGTTHKFRFRPYRQVIIGVWFAAIGAAFLTGAVAAVALEAQPVVAWAIAFAILGLVFVWAAIGRFRMGVRVSGQKLTIANELWTHTINASDIREITLKPKEDTGNDRWRPRVELTNGKGVWIDNFDCGPERKPPRAESAAIVEEVRSLLGIRGDDPTRTL